MREFTFIEGGVTAAKGFTANGIHCGIRKNKNKADLSLIFCEKKCKASAVYTQNLVYGAPITVTRNHLANNTAQAVICNSGIANTCNADGIEKAEGMCKITAQALGISENDVIVASTGVIGQPLDLEPIQSGMSELVNGLRPDGSPLAAAGIMTTDTRKKEFAVEFQIGNKTCKMGLIAKGSGMIHPNMATMLCFITTDVNISPDMLDKALHHAVADSFNMLSIDGDTSTNDMVSIMASGLAENPLIDSEDEDFKIFKNALNALCVKTVREMARDGEGATKLIECRVHGANSIDTAKKAAKSIICSSLVKTAMFGADANWGRILCAIGYAGVAVDVHLIDVAFHSKAGQIIVCENGAGISFSEEKAKEILLQDEIIIKVNLNSGNKNAAAFGCDLTYDYVKINGDYRT